MPNVLPHQPPVRQLPAQIPPFLVGVPQEVVIMAKYQMEVGLVIVALPLSNVKMVYISIKQTARDVRE